jgi:hypothetical protein
VAEDSAGTVVTVTAMTAAEQAAHVLTGSRDNTRVNDSVMLAAAIVIPSCLGGRSTNQSYFQ